MAEKPTHYVVQAGLMDTLLMFLTETPQQMKIVEPMVNGLRQSKGCKLGDDATAPDGGEPKIEQPGQLKSA